MIMCLFSGYYGGPPPPGYYPPPVGAPPAWPPMHQPPMLISNPYATLQAAPQAATTAAPAT